MVGKDQLVPMVTKEDKVILARAPTAHLLVWPLDIRSSIYSSCSINLLPIVLILYFSSFLNVCIFLEYL